MALAALGAEAPALVTPDPVALPVSAPIAGLVAGGARAASWWPCTQCYPGGVSATVAAVSSTPAPWRLDVDEYFARLGYSGSRDPSLSTLVGLHAAHRRNVPYENLDVALRRPLSHAPEALFDKVVRRRRGGWCHELNRLFALLLETLEFRLTYHSARVHRVTGEVSPEFSHLVLVVHLEERWLADAGFGARGPVDPLRLDTTDTQITAGDRYKVIPDPDGSNRRMVYGAWLDAWSPLFSLDLQPRLLPEFDPRRQEQQADPWWTERRMTSISTQEGRVSLDGMRLVVTRPGTREERLLADDADWRAALTEHFGIDLERKS